MKKTLTFIAAIMIAAITFTACQNLETSPSPYSDTAWAQTKSLDIANFVANNQYMVNSAAETIVIKPKAPFETRIPAGDAYKMDNSGFITGGTITLSMQAIPTVKNDNEKTAWYTNPYGNIPSYDKNKTEYELTRDVTVYVKHYQYRNVEGFGDFGYPVSIRQRGADGTYYLSAEQLKEWKDAPHSATAKMFGNDGQRYIKGVITDIGEITKKEMTTNNATGYWSASWINDKKYFINKTLDIQTIKMNINGETITVEISYFEEYKLLDKLNLKSGDSIEVAFKESGCYNTPGVLHVSPVDIFKN